MKTAVEKLKTSNAPAAVGPYSQGIKFSGPHQLIFTSGQLPIDPATGEVVKGDIRAATRRVMENIRGILETGGSSFDKTLRFEIFLTDIEKDFSGMNEEFARYFSSGFKPARQTVGVSTLALGAAIEISCIAYVS